MSNLHRSRIIFPSLLLLAFAGFVALGSWQLQRLAWKRDLIARVDARLQAAPVPAPSHEDWPKLSLANDEYRRVCIDGSMLNDKETLVQAVTRLGPGNWVLTPLRSDDGNVVLINRGFVDPDHRGPMSRTSSRPGDPVHLCGLLRLSEPGGAFLHRNDPTSGRWYSRDLSAIASAQGFDPATVAPYFIDAEADPDPASWPVGGLTVVHFRNSHLSYAITWYGLALLCLGGLAILIRQERTRRVQSADTA